MYNEERVNYLLTQPKTEEVVDELLSLNYGLLIKQLKKFYMQNDPDAISYGYEALYKAIVTYNGASKFSTYATVCIYNRLGSHVRSLNTQIVVNTELYEKSNGTSLLDTMESPIKTDGALLDSCGVDLIMSAVRDCLDRTTNYTHSSIIKAWVESDFKKTQTTIAEEFGYSQTYVAQILKKFKSELKGRLKNV